jgi:hypothetical protein
LAGAMDMNTSGTPPPASTTLENIEIDHILATSADKAVKAILPFLKELSNDKWWTVLIEAWVKFEVKGPPKLVSSYL